MKTAVHSKRTTAFTLVELIVCIVLFLLLSVLFLIHTRPGISRKSPPLPKTLVCSANLKQQGLCVLAYALDNGDRYPWDVPVSEGGTKELAEPFLSVDATPFLSAKEIDLNQIPDPTDWYRKNNIAKDQTFTHHFAALSNEFGDFRSFSRLTVCPGDSPINKNIQNFQDLFQSPGGGRYNISYFINFETYNNVTSTSNTVLFGDRNLFCSRFPMMKKSHNPILFQRGTNPDPENFSDIQWKPKFHKDGGKVFLTDGSIHSIPDSIQNISNKELPNYLARSTNSFNRIVLPFGKRP